MQPYPVVALPASVREAVEEVQAFTQAPAALIAASALSAISVAAQGLANVQRDEGLTGPIGLWFLTIAESGERKSTADGHFTHAIREYETEQAELAKPAIARHMAAVGAWEAKSAGLREAIKTATKRGKATDADEQRLREVQADMPLPTPVPRLLYSDATPEALAHGMKRWPSSAVISPEAGAVLGAHAMGRDSIVRNLALLNSLWDGGELRVDRRTSESFTVRGARLTISLQAQPAAMRDFFDKAGPLARGVGFIARFLVAWPQSTQGTRQYREAPQAWPALSAFNHRVAALLASSPAFNERGELNPPTLTLAPEAKAAWIRFYDDVETELRAGGDLTDVRDVASKAADNAARLAALFHVFEGDAGAVSLAHVQAACRLVAWHLTEARRFLGEFSLPPALANAARLDAWLLDYCRAAGTGILRRRTIQQKGPNATRDGKRLDEALRELCEAGRIREYRDTMRRDVAINPALLGAQS
ncbi:MAG: YfjI family protein [Casimicrobiaceae bacterium]